MFSRFHLGALLIAACAVVISGFEGWGAPSSRWIDWNDSDTVFVFVHGVLSDSGGAWTHKDGTFWPDLLFSDERFGWPSVYVAGYATSSSDPNFGTDDTAC